MLKTREEILQWLGMYAGNAFGGFEIREDLSIDAYGDTTIRNSGNFPVVFNKSYDNFDCSDCALSSLEGCPTFVSDSLNCEHNNLTSLADAPKIVDGNFNCSHNQLTSLEGVPETVGGSFICTHNQLTSLEGAPKFVDGTIYSYGNPLNRLGEIIIQIGGDFYSSPIQNFPVALPSTLTGITLYLLRFSKPKSRNSNARAKRKLYLNPQ